MTVNQRGGPKKQKRKRKKDVAKLFFFFLNRERVQAETRNTGEKREIKERNKLKSFVLRVSGLWVRQCRLAPWLIRNRRDDCVCGERVKRQQWLQAEPQQTTASFPRLRNLLQHVCIYTRVKKNMHLFKWNSLRVSPWFLMSRLDKDWPDKILNGVG